jgi:hypothetical protein
VSTGIRILIAALLLFGVVVLVGAYAYNAGVQQGLVYSGKAVVPESGPYVYPPMYGYGGPFSWGLGPLACLFPLFGLFLVFALFRVVFGHHRWGMHGHSGPREEWRARAQEHFDAMHRTAHGGGGDTPAPTA